MHYFAAILAGGIGERSQQGIPKQYAGLHGHPLLYWTLAPFLALPKIEKIVIVANPEYHEQILKSICPAEQRSRVACVAGGDLRLKSSFAAVSYLKDHFGSGAVMIHDSARPFLTTNLLQRIMEKLETEKAVDTLISVTDTIVEVSADGQRVEKIPDKRLVKIGQTPQAFDLGVIFDAQKKALSSPDPAFFSDDCGTVSFFKLSHISVVEGERDNFKVTYPEDFIRGENVLRRREERK